MQLPTLRDRRLTARLSLDGLAHLTGIHTTYLVRAEEGGDLDVLDIARIDLVLMPEPGPEPEPVPEPEREAAPETGEAISSSTPIDPIRPTVSTGRSRTRPSTISHRE